MSSNIFIRDTIIRNDNINYNHDEFCWYLSIVHQPNMNRVLLHNDYYYNIHSSHNNNVSSPFTSLFQHTTHSNTFRWSNPYHLSSSIVSSLRSRIATVQFLPDFTEHPKPLITRHPGGGQHPHQQLPPSEPPTETNNNNDNDQAKEQEITFFHDFIAGGVAGSASVIVGHPFDTIKVRMQTSKNVTDGIFATFTEFGGMASLFRGITAPLYTAALVNAIIFASYGLSSRVYNDLLYNNNNNNNNSTNTSTSISTTNYNNALQPTTTTTANEFGSNVDDHYDEFMEIETTLLLQQQTHDPWQKAMICGAFAGLMQCFIICPMEHVKCRLQIQHDATTTTTTTAGGGKNATLLAVEHKYKSPYQATRSIVTEYGIQRLYQGWWVTCWREVPAFGLYFAIYDYLKDQANDYIASNFKDVVHTKNNHNNNKNDSSIIGSSSTEHSHTWLASAFAGGCAGCITWAIVYPLDVIKTHIQTSCLSTPKSQLRIIYVGYSLIQQYGIQYLFRGLGITLIRAFPVNGTIFPVYEFTLKQVCRYTDQS